MATADGRIWTLEALRGLAAVCVALFHLEFAGHIRESGVTQGWFLFVDFFFVLSGFVLSHAYLERLRERSQLLPFAIRRFGRLWPLHAVLLAALVCLEAVRWQLSQHGVMQGMSPPFTETRTPWSILTNALLVHALGMHDSLTWNQPSWSISVECAAYAVFAVVAVGVSRTAWAAVLIAAGSAGLLCACSGTMDRTYDLGLLRCLYGFFLGHLACLVFARIRTASLPMASLWEVGVVVGAVLFVHGAGRGALGLAAPLVFVPVVLVFSFQQGALSRVLRAGVFQSLGRWSYSIYLVHTLVLLGISYAVKVAERLTATTCTIPGGPTGPATLLSFGGNLTNDAMAAGYLVVVVAVAACTYRWIERPGQEYFNGVAARCAGRPPVTDGR